MSTKKILLLWDRMGDYHRARWNALSQQLGPARVYAADLGAGDGLYKWDNTGASDHYFRLSDKKVDEVGTHEALTALKKIVSEHRITHVCIPGYGRRCYIAMLLWCRYKGIKVLMFAESWYPKHPIGDWGKGLLIRTTAQGVLASGKHAANHFAQRLRYPHQRIIEGYSVVDNTHFQSPNEIEKSVPPQLLCVARFAPEKNLRTLIGAFQQSTLANNWQLRIVGGGPLLEELKAAIELPNIKLDNWLSYAELPAMYAQASCFILPSQFEPWGLVVNEAMAAGLPVILSDAVGALPDLLQQGVNGWSFPHDDEKALTEILNQLHATDETKLKGMGTHSLQIIANYSTQTWAEKVGKWMDQSHMTNTNNSNVVCTV